MKKHKYNQRRRTQRNPQTGRGRLCEQTQIQTPENMTLLKQGKYKSVYFVHNGNDTDNDNDKKNDNPISNHVRIEYKSIDVEKVRQCIDQFNHGMQCEVLNKPIDRGITNINEKATNECIRELTSYLQLNNCNLKLCPSLYGYEICDDSVVLNIEHATYGTLSNWLKTNDDEDYDILNNPIVPFEIKLSVSIRILIAIILMHEKCNISQNDITGNIFVTHCNEKEETYTMPNGNVYTVQTYGIKPMISDFGLATYYNKMNELGESEEEMFMDDMIMALNVIDLKLHVFVASKGVTFETIEPALNLMYACLQRPSKNVEFQKKQIEQTILENIHYQNDFYMMMYPPKKEKVSFFSKVKNMFR